MCHGLMERPCPCRSDAQSAQGSANVLITVRDRRNGNKPLELKGLDVCQVK